MLTQAALYARVSTDRQDTGLEAQLLALRDYCTSKNVIAYEIFSDTNVSGSKVSRPGLDRMMEQARAGAFQSVVVYSFSRFARSTQHLLSALEEFKTLGISFVSISEQIDTSSALGKAIFVIVAAVAELERELIRERVRTGICNARSKGKRIGRPVTRPGELIRTLAGKGHSYREIGRLVGCSQGAIADELRSMRSEKVFSSKTGSSETK
ncbi:MAG: hypothetical protein A2X94_09140 [Bdellovibrionales bacterium GWB1_55_8]|nr:MAG: hypothetical protein A2X94_09140 [Bdellovibrionales bacterium GWB1_55_8]